MKLVGLVGKSGAGKTQICKFLASKGAYIIDGDHVAHYVMATGTAVLDELVSVFGTKILRENGSLNRKVLGAIVFSDPQKLNTLNTISHKYISVEMDNLIQSATNYDIVVIDAAALIESGYHKKCDYLIAVIADEHLRLKRIMERDNIDEHTAKNRIKAQRPDEFYTKEADFVIYNNENDDLISQIEEIYNKIYENN